MSSAIPVPEISSPYEGKKLGIGTQLALSSYWLGSNLLWGAMLVVVVPRQIEEMAPTRRGEMLGLTFSIAALVALFVPLIVGGLSDRCASRWGRRRPFIFWGTLGTLAGLFGMLLAGNALHFGAYLAAYCVVQLGNNVATSAYSGVIPDLVPKNQRGVASGYMAFMSQVGTLVGALACGPLVEGGNYLAVYTLIGVGLLFFMLTTVIGIKENPLPYAPPKLDWAQHFKSLWIDPKKYPDFAWVWLTRALVMLGFYGIQPFVQYYLRDVIGVTNPATTAAILMGLILIGATVSSLVGGAISDRTGRKPVVYVANSIIAAMALALVFCRTLEQALFVGVIFGLGYGAYVSVDWALGTDVLPNKKDAGKDMAVWHISMVLPQSIAPAAAGLMLGMFGLTMNPPATAATGMAIAAHTVPGVPWLDPSYGPVSQYPVAGYASVFIVAALMLSLGAVLLRNVRGTR